MRKDIQFENSLTNIQNSNIPIDKVAICSKDKKIHLDITPLYLDKLPRKALNPEELTKLNDEYHHYTSRLIEELGEAAFAPQLKMNSAVIFRHNVIHGSFSHDGLTRPRYSADIRFIGDFDKSVAYEYKERAFIFKRYIRQTYDPFLVDKPQAPPSMDAQLSSLQAQLQECRQQLAQLQARTMKNQLKRVLRPIVKPILKSLRLRS